jgi:hypothetical protein
MLVIWPTQIIQSARTAPCKYEVSFAESESTEELREKLAALYAERTLTRAPIEPEDQAEAILLLVSRRLSKTTDHVIPVDGGLPDGFLR